MTSTATPLTDSSLSGDYTLDPAHSRIGFAARQAMVATVRGQFSEFDGTVHLG